jgi:hypothetical protein
MRRSILRILLCLLLGAVTTVAVAWGISLFHPPLPVWAGSGGTRQGFGALSTYGPPEVNGSLASLDYGLPWIAMRRWVRPLPEHQNRLPLFPLMSGFAIDTLFYAAIWFGLFFGFASARRAVRRARGRCPMCGYDLRGALEKGCSECGWNQTEAREPRSD